MCFLRSFSDPWCGNTTAACQNFSKKKSCFVGRVKFHGVALPEIMEKLVFVFVFAGRVEEAPFQKFVQNHGVVSGSVCRCVHFVCASSSHDLFFFFEVSKCCMDTFFASRNWFPDHLPPCKSGRARKEVLAGCGADTFSLCECKVRDDLLRPFNFFLLFNFMCFYFPLILLFLFLFFFFLSF